MAEFISAKYICERKREYVKSESRRIRLAGVRAKVAVLTFEDCSKHSYKKVFSWADITVVIHRFKKSDDFESCKRALLIFANDASIHGILISGRPQNGMNIQKLYDLIPIKKDIAARSKGSVAAFLCSTDTCHMPPAADAIMAVLRDNGIAYNQKTVCIIGSGNCARSLAFMLYNGGACVSLNANTNYPACVAAKNSDILISLSETDVLINKDFINDDQTIIDIGHHKDQNGIVCGSVDIHTAEIFVENIVIFKDSEISLLADYMLAEHVLKSADADIKTV